MNSTFSTSYDKIINVSIRVLHLCAAMKPSSQRLVRTKAFAQPQILAQKLKTIYSFVSTPDVMHCAVVVEAGSDGGSANWFAATHARRI